jgi:redox-sensitive bicupin YhaK (pirin superfamily)
LFEGAIEHRDSIGSHAVIEPGAINLMTAGSGIVHSERSPQAQRAQGPSLYGMQTWLALPDGGEEVAPAFDHVPSDDLPLIEDGRTTARVLMGTLWGATAATPQHSPTIYADIELGSGSSIAVEADADERAVMLVGGEADIDGRKLDLYALYVLRPGHAARLSSARGARAMLMGGQAFSTRRYVFWNFVSSSRDRINQAKEDWKALRFPLIPGDDQEFIPLPEKPKTVSYP